MLRQILLTSALAVAFLVPGPVASQTNPLNIADRLSDTRTPLIIAHRANGSPYPENSLAAIQFAIETGVEMVQFDIQVTRDGGHVLMHNYSLNGMTDVEAVFPDGPPGGTETGSGARKDRIVDYTLEQIGRLHLTGASDGPHPVPTLADALALVDGQILAAISIKSLDPDGLVELLRRYPTDNLLLTTTVDARWTRDVAAETGIRIWANIPMSSQPLVAADVEEWTTFYGPDLALLSVWSRLPTPAFVERAQASGVAISAYLGSKDYAMSKGDVSAWKEAMRHGVSVFLTDHPGRLADLLAQ